MTSLTSLRRALISLAVVGFAIGLATAGVTLSSHHQSERGFLAVLTTLIAWSFIGTGLFAWWRRPANRSGALMTGIGFAWFFVPLNFSNSSWPFMIGLIGNPVALAMLGHLVLAFPRGRLETRYHRRLVAAGYFTATLLQLPALVFYDTANESNCAGCPSNPLLIAADHNLYVGFRTVLHVTAVVVIALVIREVGRRVRSAQGSEKQVYSPVMHAGAAALLAFGLLFASVLVHGDGMYVFRALGFLTLLAVPYAFLAGLVRGRLSRAGAVAELVEALGSADERRRSLRDALAEALEDSSLSLAYWLPERGAYVDPEGRPVELPGPGSGRIATEIEQGGAPLAVIVHDESLAEERDLVRAVGGAAALTLENERLAAELRARIEELRASRARIVQATDDERRRLERDLHDGAQQRLVALALNLRLAQSALEDDPATARELLGDAIDELSEATAELRELARGIHPAILTDRGLDAALAALAGRASVPVELRALPEERLAAPVESTAYFVVAEALTNVSRYAQASHAEVEIGQANGTLVVEVRDDGVGGADARLGSGLRGLADRVAAVDGRLLVTSPSGDGTTVRAEIPCAP
jgi:signal transduction histidine kinase